jgi:hypothetical protein
LISGTERHLCGRGLAPQWNTSLNVAIQERFLCSVDYTLQQTTWLNSNADRRPICTNAALIVISIQHLSCRELDKQTAQINGPLLMSRRCP